MSLTSLMKRWTHGFRLGKIQTSLVFPRKALGEEASFFIKDEAFQKSLKSPFLYLDRGAQCFVFVSFDEKYVLKIFRYDTPVNPIRRWVRKFFQKKEKKTKQEKVSLLITSSQIAYERLKEETGLLFTHLHLTKNSLPTIQVKAPLGKIYRLSLDEYRFVLQKKGSTLKDTFLELYQKGEKEKASLYLQSLKQLLIKRAKLGVRNSDPNLTRNFGFCEGKAMEIDFGSYIKAPFPLDEQKEVREVFLKLEKWFQKEMPDWKDLLQAVS